jgi:hypothetical protein
MSWPAERSYVLVHVNEFVAGVGIDRQPHLRRGRGRAGLEFGDSVFHIRHSGAGTTP